MLVFTKKGNKICFKKNGVTHYVSDIEILDSKLHINLITKKNRINYLGKTEKISYSTYLYAEVLKQLNEK